MSPMAYIGFGSNLGGRKTKFRQTLEALNLLPDTIIWSYSRLYETEPVGISDGGPKFINAAIVIETELDPAILMELIHEIELRLGKSPNHSSDRSRPIDLDLLLFADKQIHKNGLEVPHPRMHRRAFVLVPLAEAAPDVVHPVLNRTVQNLLQLLPEEDLRGVSPIEDAYLWE
jgi:2-amino-4-hydroxy-6-hydroxymethyldihydropteridine diphosphokinase